MRWYTDILAWVRAGLPVPTSRLAPGSALKRERCVPAGEPALGTTRGANVLGEGLCATTQGRHARHLSLRLRHRPGSRSLHAFGAGGASPQLGRKPAQDGSPVSLCPEPMSPEKGKALAEGRQPHRPAAEPARGSRRPSAGRAGRQPRRDSLGKRGAPLRPDRRLRLTATGTGKNPPNRQLPPGDHFQVGEGGRRLPAGGCGGRAAAAKSPPPPPPPRWARGGGARRCRGRCPVRSPHRGAGLGRGAGRLPALAVRGGGGR